jgi:outer membrane protein assembly factor BamB
LLAALLAAACAPQDPGQMDALRAVPRGDVGEPVMSLRWKVVTSDRSREVKPQEFAAGVVYRDHVYAPSAGGWMYALRMTDGRRRWKKKIGAVDSQPAAVGGNLYVGTDDGILLCLDAQTGTEVWRYATRGPILRQPVVVELPGAKLGANPQQLVVFSNEADQVYALDAVSGEFKWQYKAESPEEYTLRGHSGVAIGGGLVYSGFANGTMVALRLENGSVAWLTSLKGDADRFVDVDATPAVIGDTVYVTSSSGGVWALDGATGLVRWQTTLDTGDADGSTGTLATDGERLYVGVADLGIHALDLGGNVLWRQGARGGGEPGDMTISGEYLFYTLADAGLFVADRASGKTYQYFDPGDGISAAPVVSRDDQLFVMSNRGVFYALDVHRY